MRSKSGERKAERERQQDGAGYHRLCDECTTLRYGWDGAAGVRFRIGNQPGRAQFSVR